MKKQAGENPACFDLNLCHLENGFVCHMDCGFPRCIEENLPSAVLAITHAFPTMVTSDIQIGVTCGT
jgi:hypothetical protein